MNREAMAVAAVLGVLLSASAALSQASPSFEVASVRPATRPITLEETVAAVNRFRPNGQLTGTLPLRGWIEIAYGLAPYQTVEGSFRELDEFFAIVAKAPEGIWRPSPPREVGPVNLMMQALLAERFKLKVRWESRPQTVLVLRQITPGRLGPKVKRLEVDCSVTDPALPVPRGCRSQIRTVQGRMEAVVLHMTDLTDLLSRMGRAVVDGTGLMGPLEMTTAFDATTFMQRLPGPAPDNRPPLTDAFRDDLGLKFDSERLEVPVLIVEHVQPPSEN